MGKEIRVGLAVVGVLLILFCALVFGRLSGSSDAPPDVSIPPGGSELVPNLSAQDTEKPRLYPTVIKTSHFDELTSPARSAPNVTGSAAGRADSSENPRWRSEPAADPELTRPSPVTPTEYLPIPAPQ